MAKLNVKQDNRTLHVERNDEEKHIVLIERERQKWAGRNRWIDSRVLLTDDEALKLAKYITAMLTAKALEVPEQPLTDPSARLDRIRRRIEALKSNHPEWANIIDAAIHAEDFE
jgi:hypothetical protein